MLKLNISSKSPAAITSSIKKIKEMVSTGAIQKTTPIHLILEPGIYREIIKYNLSNPLILECAAAKKPSDCIIQADNCEAFNKGLENRAVFTIGPNATDVTLKNFTILNTHTKSHEGSSEILDSAEALVWNNTSGTLTCKKMSIEGRKNTLHIKGFTWFLNSQIIGDVDFIYGDCDTAFFENCTIHIRDDNRGDHNGFAINSQALANKKGFIFSNCTFTGEKRRRNSLYLYRTDGKGSATSLNYWDSIALINCTISDLYSPELVWDNDMNLELYPRGNALLGFREYNSSSINKNGHISEADTSRRNIRAYTLTEENFYNDYASRYLIFRETPFVSKMI